MSPAASVAGTVPVIDFGAPPLFGDPRFQLPAALVLASALAVGTFAVLHVTIGRRLREKAQREPLRGDLGFVFPESGVVLCPQSAGLTPTEKPIRRDTFIVLWLADTAGEFVQTTWAKVLEVDPNDPNRILVMLTGELTSVGQRQLDARHGFALSQTFWMTRDCVPEAYDALADRAAVILCGALLESFDGDGDGVPDGFSPVRPPTAYVEKVVGRDVELLLVSRAGRGTAWQATILATIMGTGQIGQIPRVKVKSISADPGADHRVSPGDTFDVTWDCITAYRS